MDDPHGVPCVIYAAKSTEDRKGSIPDQLHECHTALAGDPDRRFVAEYTDETFSAFRRNRGPGLRDAMQHAEDLAEQHGTAELWAQHSDRLARGDGRSARHAVEIALWALKHAVRVRTLQDPDTFRDLLYAVVTGQRNHEDSLRKGRSSAAGRRRAAARGDFIGYLPDGYRLAVELDEHGTVRKCMEFDPVRQPLIEMIFRLYLGGERSGAIARAASDAGWLTKPFFRDGVPRTWTVHRVVDVLNNPRYAGLAIFDGEIVARGHWPAYITERQHTRIKARLGERRPTKEPRQLEAYLLARLGICGRCGSPLFAVTGGRHRDGTLIRSYVCASHHSGRHAGRCRAAQMDAGLVEAMFVSSLATLLLDAPDEHPGRPVDPPSAIRPADEVAERQRLSDAVLAGDQRGVDDALNVLFARMQPEAALIRDTAITGRRARQLQEVQRFRTWIAQDWAGRTDASREQTRELNRLLRSWFSTVAIKVDPDSVEILARHRPAGGAPSPAQAGVRIDRAAWTRFAPLERQPHTRYRVWQDAEILGAMQAWADAHGHSPTCQDWRTSRYYKPTSPAPTTHTAGRSPARDQPRPNTGTPSSRLSSDPWDDLDVIHALTAWTAEHGRPPAWAAWLHQPPEHPSTTTVRAHFGSWQAALTAARLEPARRTATAATSD